MTMPQSSGNTERQLQFIVGFDAKFGRLNLATKYDYAAIIIGFIAMLVVGLIQEKGIDIKQRIFNLPYPVKFVLLMVFVFVIIVFGAYGEGYGVVDLVYANF